MGFPLRPRQLSAASTCTVARGGAGSGGGTAEALGGTAEAFGGVVGRGDWDDGGRGGIVAWRLEGRRSGRGVEGAAPPQASAGAAPSWPPEAREPREAEEALR